MNVMHERRHGYESNAHQYARDFGLLLGELFAVVWRGLLIAIGIFAFFASAEWLAETAALLVGRIWA